MLLLWCNMLATALCAWAFLCSLFLEMQPASPSAAAAPPVGARTGSATARPVMRCAACSAGRPACGPQWGQADNIDGLLGGGLALKTDVWTHNGKCDCTQRWALVRLVRLTGRSRPQSEPSVICLLSCASRSVMAAVKQMCESGVVSWRGNLSGIADILLKFS